MPLLKSLHSTPRNSTIDFVQSLAPTRVRSAGALTVPLVALLVASCGPTGTTRNSSTVRDVHAGSYLPTGSSTSPVASATALYFSQSDPRTGKAWAYHALCPGGLTPSPDNCIDWDAMPLALFKEQLTEQASRDLKTARVELDALMKGASSGVSTAGRPALDERGRAAALETLRARIRDIEARQETEARLLGKMARRAEIVDVPLLVARNPWESRFEAQVMARAAEVFRAYVLQPLVRGPWVYTLLPKASALGEARTECERRNAGTPAFGTSVFLNFSSKDELAADSARARAEAAELFTNPASRFVLRASHGTKCLVVRDGEALITLPRPAPSASSVGRPLSDMRASGGISAFGLDRFNNPVNRIGRAFNGGNSRVFVNTSPSILTDAPPREFSERVNDVIDFSQGTQSCGRDAVTRQELSLVVCRQAR